MKVKNIRTLFYCVIQPEGNYCLWSIARNRGDSWRLFLEGLAISGATEEAAKQKYQKEGLRCIAVRITPEEEK
jgi:hypothetical protein